MSYRFNLVALEDEEVLEQEEETDEWAKQGLVVNTELFSGIGIVAAVADGIITITGLEGVSNGEEITFFTEGREVPGLVLNLARDNVSAVIFETAYDLKPGVYVTRNERLIGITVDESVLGRIVDPLGRPLDGGAEIQADLVRPLEVRAPSILARTSVRKPLETGIKVIDSLVPIGHGQRELIIGDSKTGKTAIAIDSILHQKGKGTVCVYVAIGQKLTEVARIHRMFELAGALDYTVIVAATASSPAASQYVAPYSGCSLGEYFMERGNNVLVVYDDLSKHAVSYRQLSLLLRRPPGREGYPGDVFYLHSRLLERAANLLPPAGSLTALPVIETIQGDVSAYIPTNVISITDGQIFLETELFAKGIRPAVSPGLSVSRVGSAAQNKTMKRLAGNLKLELAQFREVEDFTKLGFALDDATRRLVDRGQKLTRLLVQPRAATVEVSDQLVLLYAAVNGFLDRVSIDQVSDYEHELYTFLHESHFYKAFGAHIVDNYEPSLFDYVLEVFTDGFVNRFNNN
jgi:F-type H+/Na+-transporting ATPase subunit alpha